MVDNLQLYLPAILAFAAVALGTIAVVLVWETVYAAYRRREILGRLQTGVKQTESLPGLLRQADAPTTALQVAVSRVPRLNTASLRLKQAEVPWSVATYVLLTIGAALTLGLVALMVTGSLPLAVLLALLGAALPDLHISRRKLRRRRAFEEQFPEAIDLLGRAIRAGHPLSAGIRMVAEEAPEPSANEFRQVFDEQRFGLPFEDALLGLSDRNELVDVRIFVTAVLIQREVGGNLAEILDKLSKTVRARFTILRQLRVYTAQGRLSGYILAVLPIVMAIVIYFLNREYIMLLFTEPVGRLMVIVAVVFQIIGYLWIRKIVNIEI